MQLEGCRGWHGISFLLGVSVVFENGKCLGRPTDPAILDAGQVGHLSLPGRDVIAVELIQMRMPARTGHDFHQVHGCGEETTQAGRRLFNVQPRPEFLLLGCNAEGQLLVLQILAATQPIA